VSHLSRADDAATGRGRWTQERLQGTKDGESVQVDICASAAAAAEQQSQRQRVWSVPSTGENYRGYTVAGPILKTPDKSKLGLRFS